MSKNHGEDLGAAKSSSPSDKDDEKQSKDALLSNDEETDKPTQLRVHELNLEESASTSVFKRQSSWKKFKESVKVTLAGWKGGGNGAEPDHENVIVENEVVVAEEASETSCAQPTIPARRIPKIVTIDDEGKITTPTQSSPALAHKSMEDNIHVSLPEVNEIPGPEKEAKSKESTEISPEMLRQAIIDAARQKIRQRASNRHKQLSVTLDDASVSETMGDVHPPKIVFEPESPESDESKKLLDEGQTEKRPILKEPLSMSNPDVSTDSHENAKLAVMKIRAAIASMTVQADFPTSSSQELSTESILSRRRLSAEKPNVFLKPTPDQLAVRSSSVDFSLSPNQRRELLEVAAASSLEDTQMWQSTTITVKRSESLRRSSSLRRSESMKRNDSAKRKKARPMIWEHFDDVPNTALQGRCKVCHMTVSCKFNTGHFVRHLQLAHPSVYQSYQTKMQTNWTRSQLERSLK